MEMSEQIQLLSDDQDDETDTPPSEDLEVDVQNDIIKMILEDTGSEIHPEQFEKAVQECIREQKIAKIIYKLTKFKTQYDQIATQFLQQYLGWEETRTNIIQNLREYADRVDLHHQNANRLSVAGSSAAITGGLTSIVGIVLSPFTFGLSVCLTVAGGATAISGAAANIGSSVVEYMNTKKQNKGVENILSEHNEETLELQETVKELADVYKSWEKTLYHGSLGEYDIATIIKAADMVPLANQAITGTNSFSAPKTKVKIRAADVVCMIQRTQLSVAQPLLVVPVQALRSASVAPPTALWLTTALHVLGALGNAAFIGFDIYNVVTTSIDISNGSKSKSGKRMRDIADALESQKVAMGKIYTQLKGK